MHTAIAHVADQERKRRAAAMLVREEWRAADHNLISQVTLECLLACLCRMEDRRSSLSARHRRRQSKCIRVVNTYVRGEEVTQGAQVQKYPMF